MDVLTNKSIRFRESLVAVLLVVSLTGCGSGGGSVAGLVPTGKTATGSTAVGAGCRNTSYTPNFASGVDPATGQPNRLYHWNHFPLKLFIVSSPQSNSVLVQQAEAGFNWWVTGTSGLITYQVVNDPSQADITVDFENRGYTNYGAVTDYSVNSNGEVTRATITFNMTYLSTVANITPVAAHEFGHALGIAGHSSNPADVMYDGEATYSKTALSTADINTLFTAYCGYALEAPTAAQSFTERCVPPPR